MFYPHEIRLRGPWDFEGVSTGIVEAGQVHLPVAWSDVFDSAFRGRVVLRRQFHRPNGIEAHEAVWLVVAGSAAPGHVSLNDQMLGALPGPCVSSTGPLAWDVTSVLLPHNRLVVELLADAPERIATASPLVNVQLEIRQRVVHPTAAACLTTHE